MDAVQSVDYHFEISGFGEGSDAPPDDSSKGITDRLSPGEPVVRAVFGIKNGINSYEFEKASPW